MNTQQLSLLAIVLVVPPSAQAQGPAFNLTAGGHQRVAPQADFSGFGALSMGVRFRSLSAGLQGWTLNTSFFDSTEIDITNLPTITEILRSEGVWGMSWAIEYDLVVRSGDLPGPQITADPFHPRPERSDTWTWGLLVRTEGDFYPVPDSSANNSYVSRSVSDGTLFVGGFVSKGLAVVRLLVGAGLNQRLDRRFPDLRVSSGLSVFELRFDELRLKIRTTVSLPPINNPDNVRAGGIVRMLAGIRPFGQLQLDVPFEGTGRVVLSDGTDGIAERIAEYTIMFGLQVPFIQ